MVKFQIAIFFIVLLIANITCASSNYLNRAQNEITELYYIFNGCKKLKNDRTNLEEKLAWSINDILRLESDIRILKGKANQNIDDTVEFLEDLGDIDEQMDAKEARKLAQEYIDNAKDELYEKQLELSELKKEKLILEDIRKIAINEKC